MSRQAHSSHLSGRRVLFAEHLADGQQRVSLLEAELAERLRPRHAGQAERLLAAAEEDHVAAAEPLLAGEEPDFQGSKPSRPIERSSTRANLSERSPGGP